jgi:hypothetical protein
MLSKHHLLLSLVTGAFLVLVTPPTLPWWVVVGLAAALGVLVDLDHFVVARLNQGDWRALTRGLQHPRLLVFEQADLFDVDALWARQRLLSHAIVATVLVGGFLAFGRWYATAPWLGLVVAATLWVHIVADLVWDNVFLERDFHRHARALGYDA